MKRSALGFTLLLAAVWVLAGGCGSGSSEEEEAANPEVPVRVAFLERRSFEDAIEVPGGWRNSGELVVSTPFASVVTSLAVRVGDAVGPGQRLGTVETRDARAGIVGAHLLEREAHDPSSRAEAERALQLAHKDAAGIPLVAPTAGIVIRRTIEPGGQASEGAEILALAPWKDIVFEAHVPPDQQTRVRIGQRAQVLEPDAPSRSATVARFLPAADPNDQTTLVWLAPVADRRSLRLGRFGTARILVGAPHVATGIPDSAVVEDDVTGQSRAAVVDSSGHAHWVNLALGAKADAWRELLSPSLPAGTRVIVEGHTGLVEGTRVRPSK